jgi:hypothetical protein
MDSLREKIKDIVGGYLVYESASVLVDEIMEAIEEARSPKTGLSPVDYYKANGLVDAILDGARKSQSSWSGREKIPEPIRDLLDVFVKISGIKPTRRQLMDWLGSGQDWLEIGAHPQDISKAYEESKPNEKGLGGFACYRPGSLTGAVQKVVGERRKSNTGMTRLERAQLEIAEMTNGG